MTTSRLGKALVMTALLLCYTAVVFSYARTRQTCPSPQFPDPRTITRFPGP